MHTTIFDGDGAESVNLEQRLALRFDIAIADRAQPVVASSMLPVAA